MVFTQIAVFLKKQIETIPNVMKWKEYYQQCTSVEEGTAFVLHTELYFYSRKPTQMIISQHRVPKLGTIAPISNNRSSSPNPFHIADNLS